MNQRIFALLFITVAILLWSGAATGRADEKAAVGNAAAGAPGLSPEERVAKQCERQLSWLTVVLAIVGSVFTFLGVFFVGFQLWMQQRDTKRQSSFEKQTNDFVERSAKQTEASGKHMNDILQRIAELIVSMKNMTDLATDSQKLALNVEKTFKEAQEQKNQALRELDNNLRLLAEGKGPRFDQTQQYRLKAAAEGVTNIQLNYGARDGELPPAAYLVRAYKYSVIDGNYPQGDEEFGKVVSDTKASSKQREIAFYNRGINRANMGGYDQAIKDFGEAVKLNERNLFYRFYLLDTALLKAREEGNVTEELATKFQKLVEDIRRTRDDSLCEPLSRQQLLSRALLPYTDLLIFNKGDYDQAKVILQGQDLRDNLPAMHMVLAAEKQANPETALNPTEVTTCLEKAKAAYSSTIELRSRLLRGMILMQCYQWTADDHDNDLKTLRPQLLADVDTMVNQGGADQTVFSPLTRKNEPLHKIREQIGRASEADQDGQ